MTAAPQPATAPVQLALEQRPEWTDWLRSQLDPQWRAGEWDAEQWLFTGDLDSPRTSSSRCRTLRCDAIIRNPASFCNYCRDHRLKSGLPREEFAATFVPDRGQSLRGQVSGQCTITRDGIRCVRPQASKGLCVAHTGSFKYHERRGTLDRWLRELVKPITEELICMVPECSGAAMNSRGLCNYHWRAWSAANRANPDHRVPAEQWASAQPPYLAAHQFTLKLLPEPLRWEMRYALQQMDQWVRVLEPHWVRGITRDLADARTLLDDTNTARLNKPHQAAVRTLNNLTSAIRTGYALFTGATPADEDVIDLRVLGLRHAASGKRRQYPGTVDLRLIPQLWLRHALRHWVTTARPSTEDFKRTLRAARIASTALASRMDAGHDPAALTFTDASAVVDAFRTALREDGAPYSSSHRRTLNGMFFQLIDYGRRTGSLDELAGPFTRVPVEHAIRIEEQDEDMLGKAIPESVIRQLDAHLDTLGTGPTYGCRDIADDARHLLYRTLYTVLRDTGRRPLEVVSLPRDCLQTHHSQTTLIWNNHKRKRLRRRLPITQATTQAIRVWQARRDQLHLPARGDAYLFPALTALSGAAHISSGYLSEALRQWVDSLPRLNAEGVDAQGNPLPFDRTLIYPYAFRHSYAQRHADAGTPVDVLRELMDHKSIAMTQRYYTVSLKRKQQAVTKLSAHVIDQTGQPAPCTPTAYEMRSVAVPYGGCTEPSNVKAGGGACPIRFQCAGCGFYRPDPSYLPAIEQHLNELRADRETARAMDAAEFVITSLTAQITAFEHVTDRMHRRLDALPAAERAQIEEAATVLRKARAGENHTLLPLTASPKAP